MNTSGASAVCCPMPKHSPPPRTGVHINDGPQDDPTRLLVHYDGRFWPVILAAALFFGVLGFTGGLWMGTDHYTISRVCTPEDAR